MQTGNRRYCIVMALTIFCHSSGLSQFNVRSSADLIKRIIPDQASSFILEELQTNEKADVFEIESRNNKIVLRGNNGVAVASALYYYLTHFCRCQITWNGTNMNIPNDCPGYQKKYTGHHPTGIVTILTIAHSTTV